MSRDEVINHVAQPRRNQPEPRGHRERESEEAQHAENGSGSQEYPFVFHYDDRSCATFTPTGPPRKGDAGLRLACSETEHIAVVEPQQEVHPAVTKCALSIEHHHGVPRGTHGLIVSGLVSEAHLAGWLTTNNSGDLAPRSPAALNPPETG